MDAFGRNGGLHAQTSYLRVCSHVQKACQKMCSIQFIAECATTCRESRKESVLTRAKMCAKILFSMGLNPAFNYRACESHDRTSTLQHNAELRRHTYYHTYYAELHYAELRRLHVSGSPLCCNDSFEQATSREARARIRFEVSDC